ncbi:hypothetical protein C5F59_027730 [Streptomyces sp. QL37]|uniref:hypothetical protein n=1 Tax=Streptomyces sp. QL37 TaxID=2093747 RepID=UPI000CF2E411|nr:hypothetical protein [Streptomyces sp. QL37]PPQ57101.1 hypothetical protein C5F59_10720 [Streptomyces sp. QL37]
MNARRVNAAAGVILAAQKTRQTAAGIASSLEAAGLLQSPESAAELTRLRARVALLPAEVLADVVAAAVRTHERGGWDDAQIDALRTALFEYRDRAETPAPVTPRKPLTEAYPGELFMFRGLVGVLRVVAQHGDMAEVKRLLAEHTADEQDAYPENVAPQVTKLRALLAPSPGELAEQRHLLDPLDHVLEHLADERPQDVPTGGAL